MEVTIKFSTDLPIDGLDHLQALICEFVSQMEDAGINPTDIVVDSK